MLVVALLVTSGAASLLRSRNTFEVEVSAKCGPNTKLFISDSEDATGEPQYTEIAGVTDGKCISKGVTTITHVKFCGPGTLTISRMSCNRHDYKIHEYKHSASEYTTQCEVIAADGTMVDGYFGSAIVTC